MQVVNVSLIGNCNQNYRKSVSFKNTTNANIAVLSSSNSAENTSTSAQRDEAIINYLKRAEKREKQAPLISLGIMALTIPILIYAMKKAMPGNKQKKTITESFRSLKDDVKIPTLNTCKSISDTLHKFLQRQVILSKATKEDLKKIGLENSSRKVLLYGPAGTGKTHFAKIFAKTLDAEYMEVTYANMNERFTGDHIETIKSIFKNIIDTASKNKDKRYVVTFNEIDAIIVPHQGLIEHGGGHITFKKEERNLFLNYIDEISEKVPNVTIIGTTNSSAKKAVLDEAALSRFGSKIRVDYPDKKCLYEALKANYANIENGAFIKENDKYLDELATKLFKRKASFRDIDNIVAISHENQITNYIEHNETKFKYEFIKRAEESYEVTDGEISGVAIAA